MPRSPTPTKFYAVRACPALEEPAIFYNENDKDALIANDVGNAIHRTFESLEEAHRWISSTKVPMAKSRKRKASLIMINPLPNQRQEQNNQKWEEKFDELIKFSETVGDGDPNLALSKEYHRPDLAAFLGHQRQDYAAYLAGKIPANSLVDRKTRFLRLLEMGVRLRQEKSYTWPAQAQKWRDYCLSETSLSVDSPDPAVAEIAQWQQKQIEEYIKMMRKEIPHEMPPHRFQKLRDWNFPFPKNVPVPKKVLKTFDERLAEFVTWKQQHGTALVPQSTKGLGEWVKEQRKEYRKFIKGEKAYISQERVDKLKGTGFVFEVRNKQLPPSRSSSSPAASEAAAVLVDDDDDDYEEEGGQEGSGEAAVVDAVAEASLDTTEL